MADATVRQRVQKHRDALRAAGLRPVQLWLPDTRQPEFREECQRQSGITAEADARDAELDDLLEERMTEAMAEVE
ncbi:antitoxin MazE family protein [Xanthobacter aminoxidans]|uniref:antitoxin MazE family protein n=1 Tax=Xanthobacter aminoxidans TaxID=186280 RepID=UPI002022C812|nr:antitoxin MazE family protein [Xanthobacter aminoxidans]